MFSVSLNIFFEIIEKNRMLGDFYIPRLSNDMKIAVQKNHLGGQILYRSLDPVKTFIQGIRGITPVPQQDYL